MDPVEILDEAMIITKRFVDEDIAFIDQIKIIQKVSETMMEVIEEGWIINR